VLAVSDRQTLHRFNRAKPCADGLRRRVLVGLWPAKISDDAVAQEIGDIASVPRDESTHCVLVAADHLA
jgi:hypothetical protein